MALKLTNNAVSTLAASIIATDTAISVQPADAGKFPTLTAGDWFPITIIAADGSYEILKCTARASAVLTVERGQEGTTAKAFDAGARIDLRLTAGALAEKLDGATLSEADAKSTLEDEDKIVLLDSEASYAIKLGLWSTIKSGIWTGLGALISGGTDKATPVDDDAVPLMDSAAADASKKLTWANMKATLKSYFDALYDRAPAGKVDYFAMSSPPTGYLKANGAAVSRTTYAALFAAIGTTFGAGDGSTTFNLPDLRGEFVRGWDDARGVDSGRAFGSAQGDQNKSHTHGASTNSTGAHTHTGTTSADSHSHTGTTSTTGAHTHGPSGGGNFMIYPGTGMRVSGGSGDPEFNQASATTSAGNHSHSFTTSSDNHAHSFTTASSGAHSHTVTVDAEGGGEARPRNVALLACIKY